MGSSWVGAFNEDEVKRILNIEPGKKPLAMLSVGYPAEVPEPTPRGHLNEEARVGTQTVPTLHRLADFPELVGGVVEVGDGGLSVHV